MQFVNVNESDDKKMNTRLFEHKLSYSYKQLLAFILVVYWKQHLESIAVQYEEAAEKYIHKKLFFFNYCKD